MIGEQIRKFRTQQGLSLSKLAEQTGISKSYLSYIERDLKKNPSIDVLKKIAAALQIPVENFFGEEEMKLDEEWLYLIRRAIVLGLQKEDFREFLLNWVCNSIKKA